MYGCTLEILSKTKNKVENSRKNVALKVLMQRPAPEEQFDPYCEAEARGKKQAKSTALKLLRRWRDRTHIAAEIFNSRLKRGHFCGYDHGSQDGLIEVFLAAKRQVG